MSERGTPTPPARPSYAPPLWGVAVAVSVILLDDRVFPNIVGTDALFGPTLYLLPISTLIWLLVVFVLRNTHRPAIPGAVLLVLSTVFLALTIWLLLHLGEDNMVNAIVWTLAPITGLICAAFAWPGLALFLRHQSGARLTRRR